MNGRRRASLPLPFPVPPHVLRQSSGSVYHEAAWALEILAGGRGGTVVRRRACGLDRRRMGPIPGGGRSTCWTGRGVIDRPGVSAVRRPVRSGPIQQFARSMSVQPMQSDAGWRLADAAVHDGCQAHSRMRRLNERCSTIDLQIPSPSLYVRIPPVRKRHPCSSSVGVVAWLLQRRQRDVSGRPIIRDLLRDSNK